MSEKSFMLRHVFVMPPCNVHRKHPTIEEKRKKYLADPFCDIDVVPF